MRREGGLQSGDKATNSLSFPLVVPFPSLPHIIHSSGPSLLRFPLAAAAMWLFLFDP
jgi:hypothetical protein